MENGWMDWIEWMWKVESGAVPDLTTFIRGLSVLMFKQIETVNSVTAAIRRWVLHPLGRLRHVS